VSELGNWLAENVMGFVALDIDGDGGCYFTARPSPRAIRKDDWDPEHNDAQAMQVLDKMIELGWDVGMSTSCDGWYVSFQNGGATIVADAGDELTRTRAEAICAAARAAIEAERVAAKPKPHRCGVGWECAYDDGRWRLYTPPDEGMGFCRVLAKPECPFCGARLE